MSLGLVRANARARALRWLFCLLALPGAFARADGTSADVDALFAKWNSSHTPGMNVSVFRGGKEIYSRSFGMADLELSVPNRADLVYPIGSLTKQFTAYCVQLLAQEGRLSLDDDIRRYLPQMHDFGEQITVRMLLTHTSGLRDNVLLLALKGRRVDDVISEQESLDVITRQTGLNFPPGYRYSYSNANYVLLAKIVEIVSGMNFADFLRQRVFVPLGMNHTSLVAFPVRVTPRRATGYSGEVDFHPQTAADSTYGNTGILSTVGDLQKWATRFYSPSSDQGVIERMLQPGALRDGTPITYASGLHVESVHGEPYIEHTGAVPGFRSELLIFPRQKLSVVLLANADDFDPPSLAFQIAQKFLRPQSAPVSPRALAHPSTQVLKQYAGAYEIVSGTSQIGPGRVVQIRFEAGMLYLDEEKTALIAYSGHEFFSPVSKTGIDFQPLPGKAGHWRIVWHDASGVDFHGRPLETEPPPAAFTADKITDYAGLYYCPELDVIYSIIAEQDGLRVRTQRGEATLRPSNGRFHIEGDSDRGIVSGDLVFTGQGRQPDGFRLSAGSRARNIRFARLPAVSQRGEL